MAAMNGVNSGSPPIILKELMRVTNLGILPESIGFATFTLQSDKFACARESSSAKNEVAIIDLNTQHVTRRQITADSVILHPDGDIIALRAQRQIQIFNLKTKERLLAYMSSEDIVYWSWLNSRSLALVSNEVVYLWSIPYSTPANSSKEPVKLFNRNPNLANSQIISVKANADESWFCLVGISSGDGRIIGNMQLYSKARDVSQAIEGHSCTFGEIQLDGNQKPSQVFCFANRGVATSKVNVVEIARDNATNPKEFGKNFIDMYFPPEATADFPVGMHTSSKYGLLYVLTKLGYFHLFEIETATCIYMNRLSSDTIFCSIFQQNLDGVIAVNRKGQILQVQPNNEVLVKYCINNLQKEDLARKLAIRANLPGAEGLYQAEFQKLIQSGSYTEAAKLAATAPGEVLRKPETLKIFQSIPTQPGQLTPLMVYLGAIIDNGVLNHNETLELARPILQINRLELLQKWFNEEKLHCSEVLGDLVKPYSLELALEIYMKADSSSKAVGCMAELGRLDLIMPFAQRLGYTPDYNALLQQAIRANPETGIEFANQIIAQGVQDVTIDQVVDMLQSQNAVGPLTAFLINALAKDLPEQGYLQTRLFEINLRNDPAVADALLSNKILSHFDHSKIAKLCEEAELYQRALELYEDPKDIKRCIVHTEKLSPEFLSQFLGMMNPQMSMDCLHELLRSNKDQNIQIVNDIAIKYSEFLGPSKLIDLYDEYEAFDGLYYYLSSIVNLTTDPNVVLRYVEVAVQTNQFTEVERICKENNVYDPLKMKNFLKERKLIDPLPLIYVCDRFDFTQDLILYLYHNSKFNFIETYVHNINPTKCAAVCAILLDLDCDESLISSLLTSVQGKIDVQELTSEFEKRNRLKLLQPFLEAEVRAGNNDQSIYNALAKIYIDINSNAEDFLLKNDNYDTLEIGKYCEKRDPYLAYIAFEKGENDMALINLANENLMFKQLAKYLLMRQDGAAWQEVLSEDNIYRRELFDQLISYALPEAKDPQEVVCVVRCLMDLGLQKELIELLEKVLLEPFLLNENSQLQNLLMLTGITSCPARIPLYIEKLHNYDVDDIGQLAVNRQRFEEAFNVYAANNKHLEAISVLIDNIGSFERASKYADQVDEKAVWSKLAKAQLLGVRLDDSIASYIRAQDPSDYKLVIETFEQAGKFEELIDYLLMARQKIKEPEIDNELLLCYAYINNMFEIEKILAGNNVADIQTIGDLCYSKKLYTPAKLMYSRVSNWGKLASTLVQLGDYQQAVDCARKSNSTQIWKQICKVCIESQEFRLAQICGLHLIVHADELQALITEYEINGYFEQLITLLEAGLGLERAHRSLFTALAVLYTRYRPEAVMDHLKLFWSRINMSKVIKACEEAHLWNELVFLYVNDRSYDNAIITMIEHSTDSFDHARFSEIIPKCSNLELYYRSLNFYLEENPMLLTDILSAMTARIDHPRVVRMFKKSQNTPLIKKYLVAVQHLNISAVNEALNEILIENYDYKLLHDSLINFDNYDKIKMAQQLENHDLLEFRRLAAIIYKTQKKFEKSIDLSKHDKFYSDAALTAKESNNPKIAQDLAQYFVEIDNRECFLATLFTCYELLDHGFVNQLAWRHKLLDFVMPYNIQFQSEMFQRLKSQEKELEDLKHQLSNKDSKADSKTKLYLTN